MEQRQTYDASSSMLDGLMMLDEPSQMAVRGRSGHLYTNERSCIQPNSEPRRTTILIVESQAFELAVVLVILANLVTMACDTPSASDAEREVIERLDVWFLWVYTVEMFMRILAYGPHCGEGSFFRNRWALFEVAIVTISWLPYMIPGYASLAWAARSFRSARVVLLFARVPGMLSLAEATFASIFPLASIFGLCSFILTVMAITGVQLFEGCLHNRCADARILDALAARRDEGPASAGLVPTDWQTPFDTGRFCSRSGVPDDARCPAGTVCFTFDANPPDAESFDSVAQAALPLLRTFLLDSWPDEMFILMDAYHPLASLYFVSLATVGGFLLLQLFLAVVSEAFFSSEKARREAEGNKPEELFDAQADDADDSDDGDKLPRDGALTDEAVANRVGAASANRPMDGEGGEAVGKSESDTSPLLHRQVSRSDGVLPPSRKAGVAWCARRLIRSQPFRLMTTAAVACNVLVAAMPYYHEPASYTRLHTAMSNALMWFFVLEMGMKMGGFGLYAYWSNRWNRLDGSLAVLSLLEVGVEMYVASQPGTDLHSLSLSPALRLLRLVRLVRALRVLRLWPRVYRSLLAFGSAIPQVVNLIVLTSCIVYIFAIIGVQIFGGTGLAANSREHFDSFGTAALTVVNIFSVSFVDVATACYEEAGLWPTLAYFVPALLFGYFLVMNLFVAILLETFSASNETTTKVDIPEEVRAVESLIAHVSSTTAKDQHSDPEGVDEPEFDEAARAASLPSSLSRVRQAVQRAALRLTSDDRFEYGVVVLIGVSTVCLIVENPRCDPNSELYRTLEGINVVLTYLFLFEAVAKVLAVGWREYFASRWNAVDFLLVSTSIFALVFEHSAHIDAQAVRTLRVVRILRPLRLLIRNPRMKLVIESLSFAMPDVLNIGGLLLLLMTLFSCIGMKMFMGAFASCTDPKLTTEVQCAARLTLFDDFASGEAAMTGGVAGRALKGGGSKGVGRHKASNTERPVWENPAIGNFDTFGASMLTLFVAVTGDNLPDLWWIGMDSEGPGIAPVRRDWSSSGFFFLAWLVIGTFMGSNLLVGAIVDTFGELRRTNDGSALMTPAQAHWVAVMREARELRQDVRKTSPRPTRWVKLRMPLYFIARSALFECVMYGVIVLQTMVMAAEYWLIEGDRVYKATYRALMITFDSAYLLEVAVKVGGLGPHGYVLSPARQLEGLLAVATALDLLHTLLPVGQLPVPWMLFRLIRLARVARILRLIKASLMKELRVLLKKLLVAAPALLNVLSVLSLVVLIYAALGVQLFTFVQHGTFLNEFANFDSFPNACLLLFQVLTGDGWYGLLIDTLIDEHSGCDPSASPSDCGSWLALPYFLSFVILGVFVFLNLVVAVVLEEFLYLWEREKMRRYRHKHALPPLIDLDYLEDVVFIWRSFDYDGTGWIHKHELPALVAQLRYPLGAAHSGESGDGGDGLRASVALLRIAQRLAPTAEGARKIGENMKEIFGRRAEGVPVLDEAGSDSDNDVRSRAVAICLQLKGLHIHRGAADADLGGELAELVSFNDVMSALICHSFEAVCRVDTPAPFLKSGAETHRELVEEACVTPRTSTLWSGLLEGGDSTSSLSALRPAPAPLPSDASSTAMMFGQKQPNADDGPVGKAPAPATPPLPLPHSSLEA